MHSAVDCCGCWQHPRTWELGHQQGPSHELVRRKVLLCVCLAPISTDSPGVHAFRREGHAWSKTLRLQRGGGSEVSSDLLQTFSYKYAVLEVTGEHGEEIRNVQWQEGKNYYVNVPDQVRTDPH